VCHGKLGGGLGADRRRTGGCVETAKSLATLQQISLFQEAFGFFFFLFFFVIGINTMRSHSQRLLSNCVFIQLVDSKYEAIIKTEGSAKCNARCGLHIETVGTACVQLMFIVFY